MDQNSIKQAKVRNMAKRIPFNYENKNSNTNVPQISLKCTDADKKEKRRMPNFHERNPEQSFNPVD